MSTVEDEPRPSRPVSKSPTSLSHGKQTFLDFTIPITHVQFTFSCVRGRNLKFCAARDMRSAD